MKINQLFHHNPYNLNINKKSFLFTSEINKLTRFHRLRCAEYKKIIDFFGFNKKKEYNFNELPFLPVQIFKEIDLILSPAMGGIIIGYEMGRLLKKDTIFSERVEGQFKLRRGFKILKRSKVLIVEDVITTGKSSLECSKLVEIAGAEVIGFACLIDRSNGNSSINKKIISQININIPTYNENNLPKDLTSLPAIKPGSRELK